MVDSLVTIALEKLTAILQHEAVLLVSVQKELQRLSRTFKQIQATLKDAEDRRIRDDAVGNWIDELKDVAYDMDEILDEWDTLKSKATEADGSCFHKKVSFLLSPITCFNHVLFLHNIGNRLKDARERLCDIAQNAHSLGLRADIREIRREENEFRMLGIKERETSSLVDESSIFGRDDDIKKIVGQLLSETTQAANEVPIILSIVGLGGLGKTTLAQLAYNSEKLKEHFHVKLWECVSEDFDVQRLTESLLKSASGGSGGSGSLNLDQLQNSLREAVRGKRFLLVLDDIWSKDRKKWDTLILPLKSGAPGSRIVITTRDEGVAQKMGCNDTHIHKLEVLSYDHCWSLFKSRAFENRSEEECRELQKIGIKIVEKCKGVPLAVKTLGSAMCLKKTKLEWELILESETWNSEEVLGGILPALFLSYRHLPSPMKQCFTYCSLFPKDWNIKKDMLVELWMAQGFIISGGSGDAELIGQQYFDDLVRRSLLQEEEKDDDGNIVRCKMHDLIHDLAWYVSKGEYSIIENERTTQNLSKARHISWVLSGEETSIPDALHEAKKLRTFFFLNKTSISMVRPNFFHHLRCLRALDLSYSDIKILPPAIKNLKHLRYLDLSYTKIKELPETVSGLCNLQTLKLEHCKSLCKLPETIKNLKYLRHLDFSFTKIEELPETVSGLCNLQTLKLEWCESLCKLPQGVSQMINLKRLEIIGSGLEYLPRGIGKLRQLQTLGLFVVNGKEGCGLRELKHLNLLQGSLTIKGLEKASGSDEAVEAELHKKQGLHELDLRWATDEVDEVNVMRTDSFLQALRPSPAHLKELAIRDFPGSQLPDWMEDPHFESLITVELVGCWKCKQLPALGKLPFLKECRISGMAKVIHMDSEFCGDNAGGNGGTVSFPMLEVLEFEDMPNWEGWELRSGIQLMPSLRQLKISECPKLNKFLPNTLLPNLKELQLDGVNNRLFLEGSLPTLPNLIWLAIRDNKELTSIAGGWFGQFKALECLKIDRCRALESLPKELQQLTMLHTLNITRCPALISLPEELQIKTLKLEFIDIGRIVLRGPLANLTQLTIAFDDKLTSLPSGWLGQLKSLHALTIFGCSALESLPEELQSLRLQTLEIRWCPQLKDRCKEGGEDWHKISHIPAVKLITY